MRFVHQKSLIHLTPVFHLRNIHLECSTCPHKFKWLLCTENHKMLKYTVPLDSYLSQSFFPLGSENIISLHKSLWKCPIYMLK